MGVFTTREIAVGIWFGIALIFMLSKKDIRKNLWDLIKILLGRKLRILWLSFFGYVGLITWFFSRFEVWKNAYLKDVIVWSFTSGIIICMNSVDRESRDDYILKVLKDNIKPIILIELLMSTFTFNIVIELVMIPFLSFVNILEAFSQVKNENTVTNVLQKISGILGLWIFAGTVYVAIDEYQQLNYSDTFISFMIPIVYLIMCIPLLFYWLIISKYEVLFYRISQHEDKSVDCITKIIKRLKVILLCKISCESITRFTRGFSYKSCTGMTEADFNELLLRFKTDGTGDRWYIQEN